LPELFTQPDTSLNFPAKNFCLFLLNPTFARIFVSELKIRIPVGKNGVFLIRRHLKLNETITFWETKLNGQK
jgi:hypothetical protein